MAHVRMAAKQQCCARDKCAAVSLHDSFDDCSSTANSKCNRELRPALMQTGLYGEAISVPEGGLYED